MLGVKESASDKNTHSKSEFIRVLAGCEMTGRNVTKMLENH
jgi:hypothetical protein